jgi:type VI secretion system protein ImpH
VTPERLTGVPAGAGLERVLREDPQAFGFFQAVRLLSRLYPARARVGEWHDPASEVVRFSASTSLAFPASEIQHLELPDEADEPADMTVNFFGLTGPQGVLPHIYTEHASIRARVRDTAFRDFLDIFNHRIISLFFRAWEKHQPAIMHEAGGEDRLFHHLLDLAGLGSDGLRHRMGLTDEVAAFYAGLLSSRARTADGLARLVGDYFGVAVEVEQFVGEWRHVDAGGQAEMGADDDPGRLGFGILGDAAWDPQARVRVRLGPLTRAQYESFIPGGAAHADLRRLARLYGDDQVGIDAQLVLARDEVPPCTLGVLDTGRAGPAPPALGRGTWLASRPLTRDPDETTLRLC